MSATYRSDDWSTSRRSQAARIGWRRRKASARYRLDQAVAAVLVAWNEYTDDPRSLTPLWQALTDLHSAYRHRHG